MAFNTIKPENLVGRQVYFKMSKKAYKELREAGRHISFTPYKLYTVVGISNTELPLVRGDSSDRLLNPYYGSSVCAFLSGTGARWILKRRAK